MDDIVFQTKDVVVYEGNSLNVLKGIREESINCVVTSPPYFGMRAYNTEPQIWGGDPKCEHDWDDKVLKHDNLRFRGDNSIVRSNANDAIHPGNAVNNAICKKCGAWLGELGLEPDPELYVAHLVEIFREIWRVLKKEGTCWLNIGDSYVSGKGRYSSVPQTISGKHRGEPIDNNRPDLRHHEYLKDKDLAMIPARVAIALQKDGWWLRSDIIWAKTSAMPESVTDRCTKSHEYIYMLTKSANYYYDYYAILEPAAYDGRKDTMFKGSIKPDEDIIARAAGERWPNKVYPTGDNHSGYFKENGEPLFVAKDGLPMRNRRDVWTINAQPFGIEMCEACGRIYESTEFRSLRDHFETREGGSRRKQKICTCGQWDSWISHFAVMPEDLVSVCVRAGCPEYVCKKCGKPWERIMEKVWVKHPNGLGNGTDTKDLRLHQRGSTSSFRTGGSNVEFHKGWQPTCNCETDETEAGTVLDPFAGSGTVGVVAKQLFRRFVGIELNPKYIELLKYRINQTKGRMAMPLFEGLSGGNGHGEQLELVEAENFTTEYMNV